MKVEIVKAIDVLNEVKKLPDPKMLWKGIPEGSNGLFVGVGKTGKTTFAQTLAISLSIGRKSFFDFEMHGTPKRVLFVNLEESSKFWGKRQNKQIERLDENEKIIFSENYFVVPDSFPSFINTDEDWVLLSSYIEKINPDVVIIDSLSHLCVGEIEKSAHVQQFNQKFRKYVLSYEKTVIVIHHNTKGNFKPVEMDSIAGSRFVTQEFEYAYGFANIPGADKENYMSMVYNKHVESENSTAYKYKFNSDGWIENIGTANKYELYKNVNVDFRKTTNNKDLIYNYIVGQASQSSQASKDDYIIASNALYSKFVETNTMSKQTLYTNLKQLVEEDRIIKEEKGEYKLMSKGDDQNERGSNLQSN